MPTQHPRPEARGHLPPPSPTNQRTSPRGGEGPSPQATPQDPNQEWRGATPRTLSREWRATTRHHRWRPPAKSGGDTHISTPARNGEEPPPPPTTAAPQLGVVEKPPPQSKQQEGRAERKGPTGDAGERPNLRGLGAPPVTVWAPPEHKQ